MLITKLQATYFVSFDLCLIAQSGKAEEVRCDHPCLF